MEIKIEYDELKKALLRNPQMIKDFTYTFLVRSQAVIKQGINQSPWRLGKTGGGVPVLSGNLKKSHDYMIQPFMFKVAVNQQKAPYADFVHTGTYKMAGRPWLRFVEKQSEKRINEYAKRLLEDIVSDLGK